MAVKAAGSPLALTEIQAEFGGSNPIGLNEYYRGGGLVPSGPTQNANIPASGAIGMYAFYGSVRSFVFNPVISTNATNYNLRAAAVAAGWDQSAPLIATVTVNAGVYLSANSTGAYAFDTGASFPAGSSLSLVNNGFIVGMGGAGGSGAGYNYGTSGGSGGGGGGPALRAQAAISITNNGTIAGGGGGGGGGQGVALRSTDGKSNYGAFGGGGGGGGRSGASANSAAGAGGPAYGYGFSSAIGSNGGVGTSASGGAGGGGGSYLSGSRAGNGGAGGTWGSAGASGGGYYLSSGNDALNANYGGPYGGGPQGYYISGNANVNWVATGTRLGLSS